MTVSNQALTPERIVEGIDKRLYALEMALKELQDLEKWPLTFVLAGGLYVSESPAFAAPQRLGFYQVHITLGELTSGEVDVFVKFDGVTKLSATLEGPGTAEIPFSHVANRNQLITCGLTDVGTGSTDIAVQLRR